MWRGTDGLCLRERRELSLSLSLSGYPSLWERRTYISGIGGRSTAIAAPGSIPVKPVAYVAPTWININLISQDIVSSRVRTFSRMWRSRTHKYRTRPHLYTPIAVAIIVAIPIVHNRVNIHLSIDPNSLSHALFSSIPALLYRFVIARTWALLAEYTIAVITRQMYAGFTRLHSARSALPGFSRIFSAILRYRTGLPPSSWSIRWMFGWRTSHGTRL